MVVDFIEAAICKCGSWRGGLGMICMLESIGTWSEVIMTEELMIGFRVEFTCVMRRSRV